MVLLWGLYYFDFQPSNHKVLKIINNKDTNNYTLFACEPNAKKQWFLVQNCREATI